MIRLAEDSDAAAIAAIWNPVIRDTLVTFNSVEKTPRLVAEMITQKRDEGYAIFVAEADGDVMGFAHYGQFRGGAGYAHTMEHTIVLAPAARGRGMGRELMGAVERHAKARGAHSIFAGVSGANTEGRAFHLAMGYTEIVRLPQVGFKFGQWLDLVLMQKFL